MSECLAFNSKAERPCKEVAVAAVVAGCVHEHIKKTRTCDEHRQKAMAGQMICRSCRQVDGHRCFLHVVDLGRPE